jgi:hypothetical protein
LWQSCFFTLLSQQLNQKLKNVFYKIFKFFYFSNSFEAIGELVFAVVRQEPEVQIPQEDHLLQVKLLCSILIASEKNRLTTNNILKRLDGNNRNCKTLLNKWKRQPCFDVFFLLFVDKNVGSWVDVGWCEGVVRVGSKNKILLLHFSHS